MNKIIRSLWLLLLLPGLGSAQVATTADGQQFYVQKERGWFWREPEPEPEEDKPVRLPPPRPVAAPEPKPSQPAVPAPAPFSVKWMRENMERYREQAIDNPTKENITAYIALQRVMLDKASTFADVWQDVIQQDTDFNESKRRPSSAAGAVALDEQARAAKAQVAQAIAERVGIWFFFRSDCAPCDVQLTALQGLAERYHFKVLPISLDGRPLVKQPKMSFVADKGQSAQLGVDTLPTTFAVAPPNNFTKLTEWVASTEEIIDRLLYASRSMGLIDDSTFGSTRPVKQVKVSEGIGQKIDPKVLDNKQSLTEFIRNEIRSGDRTHSR